MQSISEYLGIDDVYVLVFFHIPSLQNIIRKLDTQFFSIVYLLLPNLGIISHEIQVIFFQLCGKQALRLICANIPPFKMMFFKSYRSSCLNRMPFIIVGETSRIYSMVIRFQSRTYNQNQFYLVQTLQCKAIVVHQ